MHACPECDAKNPGNVDYCNFCFANLNLSRGHRRYHEKLPAQLRFQRGRMHRHDIRLMAHQSPTL